MYQIEDSIHINFYGPPGTIKSLSYGDILAGNRDEAYLQQQICDKVVFIGTARQFWSGQSDGFYTVFSREDGLDISGVEIAATTFANLLDNRRIRPLSPGYAVLLFSITALGCALCCAFFSPRAALVVLMVLTGAYLGLALWCFDRHTLWVPVIIPGVLQVPLALSCLFTARYLTSQREKEHISKALGYYLPKPVVKELAKDLGYITSGDRMVYAACLMTDAQNYTSLAEALGPEKLGAHMKAYYQHLFAPVKDNHGVISDVVGDAMLALWVSTQPDQKNDQRYD